MKNTRKILYYIRNTAAAVCLLGMICILKFVTPYANPVEELVDANILLGKLPSTNSEEAIAAGNSGSTASKVRILNEDMATDGRAGGSSIDENNTKIIAGQETGQQDDIHKNGFDDWKDVYLEYDFGKLRDVKKIIIYRNTYDSAVSTFLNVKVELSDNKEFTDPVVVCEQKNIEETIDSRGEAQVISLEDNPVKAQYIRIWGRGHHIRNFSDGVIQGWSGYSNGVLFNEIEVIAPVLKSELPQAPAEIPAQNIALNKKPYVRGLQPTNIQAISDGRLDGSFAIHNSLGERYLQFEYKNIYTFKKINFKLEPGNYKKIEVFICNGPTDSGMSVYRGTNVMFPDSMMEIDVESRSITGKCVRFTVNRSDFSPSKYEEVEIWATGKSFDESKPVYKEPESEYNTLVWNDEFDGNAVDETKWNIIDKMANHGAIYNRGAVSIKKVGNESFLAINTKNYGSTQALINAVGWDRYQDQELNKKKVTWSSGRIESKNKFSFQFGRIAVRAKVNDSKGIWPAIWMLCQDETGHDEIDILEYLGQDSWDVWTTNHFGILDAGKDQEGKQTKHYEAYSEDFHVYEAEWSPDAIKFFIDGNFVFSTSKGKYDKDGMHNRPMFPILETQVGDGWVGEVDYEMQDTKQDSDYLVDYIRIYQKPGQKVVRFDDLSSLQANPALTGYTIAPISHTDELIQLTDGTENYENKNNFFYGGQPRYETSRLAVKEGAASLQSLTYYVPKVSDVHLTAYYQTVSDHKRYIAHPVYGYKGKCILDSLENDEDLDFLIYTSPDGKEYTVFEQVKVVENYPEAYPSYARITIDAYSLPEDTNYVKIEFPSYEGKTYKLDSGYSKEVRNTDIQLAKVTFLQEYKYPAPPVVSPTDPAVPEQKDPQKPISTDSDTSSNMVFIEAQTPERSDTVAKEKVQKKTEDTKNNVSVEKASFSPQQLSILNKAFESMKDGVYVCKIKHTRKYNPKKSKLSKTKNPYTFNLTLPKDSKKNKNAVYFILVKNGKVVNYSGF